MYKNITGIILAGGKSTRMGENKSLLKLDGVSVIERITNLMQSIFKDVIIITNTPQEYEFISVPLYKDVYEHRGPLAGIHSGLLNSKTEENFIISCDMPLINKEIIEFIIDFETSKRITVCVADGFVQQLAGRYSKDVLPTVEELLNLYHSECRSNKQIKKKCNVHTLLNESGAEIIDAEKLDFYSKDLFYNMNRPKDYELIISRINNI